MPRKKEQIEKFDGVNDVFADSVVRPGFVRRQFGLVPSREFQMRRMDGALVIATSGDSCPAIISLGNLHFRDQDAIVVHCLSSRQWIDTADIDVTESTIDGIEEFGI